MSLLNQSEYSVSNWVAEVIKENHAGVLTHFTNGIVVKGDGSIVYNGAFEFSDDFSQVYFLDNDVVWRNDAESVRFLEDFR